MQKYIKPTILILIIIFIFGQGYYYFFSPYGKIDTSFRINDFEGHRNDYEIICNEVIRLSKANNFKIDEEDSYIFEIHNSSTFYCRGPYSSKQYILELSYTAYQSMNNLDDSFTLVDNDKYGYNLQCIHYFKNRIYFCSENGKYVLVYSFNDTKPEYLFNASKEEIIKVKKSKKIGITFGDKTIGGTNSLQRQRKSDF